MLRSLLILALFVAVVGGCSKRTPTLTAQHVEVGELFLQPAPILAARLEYLAPNRKYIGPAHLEVASAEIPIELTVEDFDLAEVFQVRIISTEPVAYGVVAGNPWRDSGTFLRDRDRLIMKFTRTWDDARKADFLVTADLAPEPHVPPADWVVPGTTLYYGITYDDKPITKLVPMALTVRVGMGSDGSRMLTWHADLDPAMLHQYTTERQIDGRRVVPAEVLEKGERHADMFQGGEEITDVTSIFVSRSVRRILTQFGGAPWEDVELGEPGVLMRSSDIDVIVQADDALWKLPATVATLHKGKGVYVISKDPNSPLIISAVRPGYRMKLMAIGRPQG